MRLSDTNAGVGASVGVDDTSDMTCVRYCNPLLFVSTSTPFKSSDTGKDHRVSYMTEQYYIQ